MVAERSEAGVRENGDSCDSRPTRLLDGHALGEKKAVSLKLHIKQVSVDKELPLELKADLIVDAIFGTGFKGKVTGLEEKAVQLINSSRTKVLSIDTPSGLDVDTGSVAGECVKADVTPTMGLPKVGQFFFPGKSYCGKVEVIDIGVLLVYS